MRLSVPKIKKEDGDFTPEKTSTSIFKDGKKQIRLKKISLEQK